MPGNIILTSDFFKSDVVKEMETYKNGHTQIYIYQRILLYCADKNTNFVKKTNEEIADMFDCKLGVVCVTLSVLEQYGVIIFEDDGVWFDVCAKELNECL